MATASEITRFIQLLGDLACRECKRRIDAGLPFILPSVCIAQSALETGYGTAGLMTRANAFFGIKAGGSWTGAVYSASTWEVVNGVEHNITANFRAYNSLEESVADYYEITTGLSRYSDALSYGSNPAAWKTPRETITALWRGGYATDELYVQKIMNTIEPRGMTAYDTKILSATPSAPPGTSAAISVILKRSDFTQGAYRMSDGELTINANNLKAIALKADNMIEAATTTTFTLNGFPSDLSITPIVVTDTSTMITGEEDAVNGMERTIDGGTKFTFHLTKKNGENFILDDLPSAFEIAFINASLPDGSIKTDSPLAYFVEIT